jgi:hypothetical protein
VRIFGRWRACLRPNSSSRRAPLAQFFPLLVAACCTCTGTYSSDRTRTVPVRIMVRAPQSVGKFQNFPTSKSNVCRGRTVEGCEGEESERQSYTCGVAFSFGLLY